MSEEKVIVYTNKRDLRELITEVIQSKGNQQPDFENDRISKDEAARLIGRTTPTLNKIIREGKLKEYGFGKRGKYLLKSEVLEALRNSNI
ncbi:MAG: hypothetical protein HQ522_02975 [Bacteroidetes bacterium]|nr:hypothetical protein [Bacteroidota bacterium]